jgi:hypothetical protein
MSNTLKPTNYLFAVLQNKCPRCRVGKLYKQPNAYNLGKVLEMNAHCPVCNQKTELETGFYFGTGYVSYALSVAILVVCFVAWYVLIGFSFKDNRVFWCLGTSITVLVLLQPFLMRLSRSIWLSWFVSYEKNWKQNAENIA